MIDPLLRAMQQPEYLHTLFNPIPIYGLGLGLLGLAIALFLRSRPAQIATLAIILASAATALPVYLLGEAAENRMEGIVDEAGREWLEVHEERAEKVIYAFYVLAILSAAALLAPRWWPRSATPLALAVFALTILTLALGGFVAHAGGKIRHKEFRTGLPSEEANDENAGEDQRADGNRGRGRGRGRGGRDR